MVFLLLAALALPVLRSNPAPITKPEEAPAPHRFTELSRLLHEAGVAYGQHDIRSAREAFQAIVACCLGQTTSMTRWYSGFAEYGIASTSARLGDTSQARVSILAALQSDYWSTDVIHSDEVLRKVVGVQWLDSLTNCYETLRNLSSSSWPKQSVLVILPHCQKQNLDGTETKHRLISLDSLTPRIKDSIAIRRPLLLALHGGNASYREFAMHWRAVADSLNVAVLIPPGCIRYSANDNSWDDTYNVCDGYLTSVLDRYQSLCVYTPDVYVAGFSQGANAGIKYGFVHSDRVKGVISIAGLMDAPLGSDMVANSASAGLRICALSGEYETEGFLKTIQETEKSCKAGNLPFHLEIVPSMAHEVPQDLASRLHTLWPWIDPNTSLSSKSVN